MKQHLLLLLLPLFGLSAKPALAQIPLEFGAGVEVSLMLMRSRAYDFPVRSDNRAEVTVEGSYGYSVYLATFPYEGWGWRADLGVGVCGRPGKYYQDEPGFSDGDVYARGRFEVLYVATDWSAVGFGASLTLTEGDLDYGGTGFYEVTNDRTIAGVHASWSQLSRWYTLTFRADLMTVAGWGRSRVAKDNRLADGRYGEWALGPSVLLSVPLNRASWIKGLTGERVIYSPRT